MKHLLILFLCFSFLTTKAQYNNTVQGQVTGQMLRTATIYGTSFTDTITGSGTRALQVVSSYNSNSGYFKPVALNGEGDMVVSVFSFKDSSNSRPYGAVYLETSPTGLANTWSPIYNSSGYVDSFKIDSTKNFIKAWTINKIQPFVRTNIIQRGDAHSNNNKTAYLCFYTWISK